MFADTVQHVASTRLFAAMSGTGQVLVYETRVATKVANAMILPVPVLPGTEAAIKFIDLSQFSDFFVELASLFPQAETMVSMSAGLTSRSATLEVIRVGAFEASIVPTIGDISRLSRRFSFAGESILPWRRERGVLGVLEHHYPDHAFVVYQIAKGESRLHPFAFEFTSRHRHLFFPTFHVHDGGAPPEAWFDHELYAQRAVMPESAFIPEEAPRTPRRKKFFSTWPAFVAQGQLVGRRRLGGLLPNQDTFAEPTEQAISYR